MSDDDLRYPVGRFEPPAHVTPEERKRYIARLELLPSELRTAVAGLSDTRLNTAYRPDGWTLRQVVHHVADSHLNGYVRFRWALTEDEPDIKTYDQEKWAELGDARQMSIVPSLALLDALHMRWVRLCRSLSDDAWHRAFVHPKSGRMTLLDALALYAWHGRHHTAHITTLREREGW